MYVVEEVFVLLACLYRSQLLVLLLVVVVVGFALGSFAGVIVVDAVVLDLNEIVEIVSLIVEAVY